MTKKQRAQLILEILEMYIPNPEIPLNHTSAFTLLIATLLSAQCTDQRVNIVTEHLFNLANTPQKMCKLTYVEVQDIIRPCGLGATKSKAIINLSKLLIEQFDGRVPKTFDELESLPGVGHKTASVVMAQAFNIPAFPVDTHIHRVAKRWGLSNGKNVKKTEEDLKKLIPKKVWIKAHLQIVLFARKYCPAKRHQISNCPICSRIKNSN
jgi:endonuclease III